MNIANYDHAKLIIDQLHREAVQDSRTRIAQAGHSGTLARSVRAVRDMIRR